MLELLTIRHMRLADENLIFSSLLSGLYYGDSWFSKIKKSIFIPSYRNVLRGVLMKATTSVRVACIKGDEDEVKGYAIFVNNEQSLFWIYVKPNWRKQGIAKALVPDDLKEVSNLTHVGEILMKKKFPNAVFNPFNI